DRTAESSTRGSVGAAIAGRVGRDDDQRLPPAGPDSGEADPQQTIHRAKLRARRRSLVDGELLAQGQVLEGELAVAADEEGEEAEHVEYEGDHEPRLWPDGADRSTTYWADGVLAKDTQRHVAHAVDGRAGNALDH